MIDYIDLGPVPANEPCAQTTDPDYELKARAECNRYAQLLADTYSAAHGKPCPARIVVKANSHDFGTYFEVVVKYDDREPDQIDAAFWLESNAPAEWPDSYTGM